MYHRLTRRKAACLARLAVATLPILCSPFAAAAVQTIAMRGDHPFGTETDATFSVFSQPSLNNRGEVAFASDLIGSDVTAGNNAGIWIGKGDALHTVIREGDTAPGMSEGTVFRDVTVKSAWKIPLNDAGEIALGHACVVDMGWLYDQHSYHR